MPDAARPLPQLNSQSLRRGLACLAAADPDLARVLGALGPPPLWARRPGFPTLIHIILEQQVSLASAKAAMDRLRAAVSPLTPRRFLTLDDATLKAIGFSRQKTAYGRYLAQAVLEGVLDLQALGGLDDALVRTELCKLKGIGVWTADIYLLMALRRPDTWPRGDLALAVAVQEVKRLPARPAPDELEALSLGWQPWRAVAARLLWHHYLSSRAPKES
jgi:DNA-3-methyladenine glycosylase II